MKIRLSELRKLISEAIEDNVQKLGRQFAAGDTSVLPVFFDALEETSGRVKACGEIVSWAIAATGIPVTTSVVAQLDEASFEINGPLQHDGRIYDEEYWQQLEEGIKTLSSLGPTKVKSWGNSITFQTPFFSGEIFEQGSGYFVTVKVPRDIEPA